MLDKLLTIHEVLKRTGIGESCFRRYIRIGLLPPAVVRVDKKPGKKHSGSAGLYHPETPAWIKEIKKDVKNDDVTLKSDSRSELRMFAWIRAVAETHLKKGPAFDALSKGLDKAEEIGRKRKA